MSSFKRKSTVPTDRAPEGTRPSPALSTIRLTSTGIPSLDDILGGGIQLGTSFLVLNPDPHSAHSELVQKYFVAQGLSCDQDVYLVSYDGRELAESCMWFPQSRSGPAHGDGDDEPSAEPEDKVKIAWRYENMQKFQTTVAAPSSIEEAYCRPFDLACRISPLVVQSAISKKRLRLLDLPVDDSDPDVFASMLVCLEEGLRSSAASNRATRIAVNGFSGPLWGDVSPEKVLRFLLRLRTLLRAFPLACALLTLPSHLSDDAWGGPGWVEKLGWMADACITLRSFSADPSMASVVAAHHGLLTIHSLPRVHTLVPASDRFSTLRGLSSPLSSSSTGGVGENNLAFKCTRKRLVFETFHLDAEGGVGERRTTPAASASAYEEAHSHADSPAAASHSPAAMASVEVQLEKEVKLEAASQAATAMLAEAEKPTQKKAKKKVGFQVSRPDLYDF